jgi:hypothetical protein
MNWNDPWLLGVGGVAIIGLGAWMVTLWARLRAIERSVQAIVANTNTLREMVELLRSVDGNTSLLGGIRGVFGSTDHKKSR